jgi:CRP-like cAMP-binding protein
LLDAMPELGERLPESELTAARRSSVVTVLELEPGAWRPDPADFDPGGDFGLMILKGAMARTVVGPGAPAMELLDVGDLLQPWNRFERDHTVPFSVIWRVLEPTRLAILDRGFTTRIAGWPELTAAIGARAIERSHRLAILSAIGHINRVQERVIQLLWHFADRRGRVGRDGVLVPLRLTHADIAQLVGARRPSVTTAIADLRRQGLLRRSSRGWLLTGESPHLPGEPPAIDCSERRPTTSPFVPAT